MKNVQGRPERSLYCNRMYIYIVNGAFFVVNNFNLYILNMLYYCYILNDNQN